MPQRFDAGLLRKPEKMDNGFLRADAFVTRVGVFGYVNSDGTIRKELRHPDEVFAADSLETLSMLPVTNEHPVGMVDSANARELSVGMTGDTAAKDGRFVRTKVQITDAAVVKAVMNGTRRELSCGYMCTKDISPGVTHGIPGVPDGQPFDLIQRDIRYNHLATTERGRAGPEVSIPRMDGLDADTAVMVLDDHPKDVGPKPTGDTKMETITIDGVQYEVSSQAAQAIRKQAASHDSAVTDLQKRLDTATATVDASKQKTEEAEKKAKEAEKMHDEATKPEAIRDAVKCRVALEQSAAKIILKDAEDAAEQITAMTDAEIRVAVIKEVAPTQSLDGKSDDYVIARFDMAVEAAEVADEDENVDDGGASSRAAVARASSKTTDAGDKPDAKTARTKMVKDSAERWRQPLPGGLSRNDAK